MQTKQSSQHLEPRRVILWLFGVQTFQPKYKTELALEVVMLLGGYQL
jgi:hypothetical protein